MKRQAKFYKRHEKVVMKKLGLEPVVGSGSGWINKEDGESEYFMAQLKSTDKNSFTIKREDLDKLEYHAMVAHKLPVFVNEFLTDGEIYLTINLKNLQELMDLDIWSQGPQSPSEKRDSEGNIIYHLNIFDSPEGTPGSRDTNGNMEHKVIKSGGREKYQKIREKEKEKANAYFKANRRK